MGVDTKWLAKHLEEQEARMSDEEVIERLREWPFMGKAMATAAADRIEQLAAINEELIAERDEAWKRAGHAETMWGEAEVKLSESEALLAKAVEIGNRMAASIEGNYYIPGVAGEWRKLTGGKDE